MATNERLPLGKKRTAVRVFVLDADEENSCVLERLLNNCGYRVQTFRNPKDYVTAINRDAPDLLLIQQSHLMACQAMLRDCLLAMNGASVAMIVVVSDAAAMESMDWLSSCPVHALCVPLHTDKLLNAMCELFDARQPEQHCEWLAPGSSQQRSIR